MREGEDRSGCLGSNESFLERRPLMNGQFDTT